MQGVRFFLAEYGVGVKTDRHCLRIDGGRDVVLHVDIGIEGEEAAVAHPRQLLLGAEVSGGCLLRQSEISNDTAVGEAYLEQIELAVRPQPLRVVLGVRVGGLGDLVAQGEGVDVLLVELVGDDRHIRPRSPDRIEFGGSGPGEGQRGGEGGELAGGGVDGEDPGGAIGHPDVTGGPEVMYHRGGPGELDRQVLAAHGSDGYSGEAAAGPQGLRAEGRGQGLLRGRQVAAGAAVRSARRGVCAGLEP